MSVPRRLLVAILFFLAALPDRARADVQRFAVVIGNNAGDAEDTPLKYAESDAGRVYDVLRDLGGFGPVNMVFLKGENARTVEDTLIAVNERIRTALSQPSSQVLLFVYYSGHADADALHLGQTRLPMRLFSQLLRGSAATFRVMVLDACRSGAVTRAKGGRIVPGAPIFVDESLPENGLAFLAAAAAHEDAQESEEIRGSFFTHAFVSGLMGAADQDGDGAVSLNEAYQHAYGATIRATSRTLFGTQHPVFRFDFAGQGAVALTRPESFASSRAVLAFPVGTGFLVLRDDAGGAVVGEVGPTDRRRSLSVRPGRYFVRGRGADVLYEGTVDAGAGVVTSVDTSTLSRTEYARLVRKGGRTSGISHGLEAGLRSRTSLPNAETPCLGGFVGYSLELPGFGVRSRLSACTSSFENERIHAVTNEYDLDLRVAKTWDVGRLSVALGLGGGAALFTQRFETAGRAPPHDSLNPYVLVEAGAAADLGAGFAAGLDAGGETHFLSVEMRGETSRSAEFAGRLSIFARKWF